MPTTTAQAHLNALLDTLAFDADLILLSVRDELYPASYDPSPTTFTITLSDGTSSSRTVTNLLIESENN